MKNFGFLAIILFTTIFISCSKDDATNTPIDPVTPALTKKISSSVYVYSDGSKEEESMRFDAKGNLTHYQDDDDTYVFDYNTPNKVFVTRRNTQTNVPNLFYDCDLNEKGLATKVVMKNPSGAVVSEFNAVYDAAGFPIRTESKYANSGNRFEFTVENGNVKNVKLYYGDKLSYSGTYTVDKSRLNTTEWRHVGHFPSPIFGQKNKNIITEYIALNPDGSTNWHTRSTFEYNTEGYITKSVTTNMKSNFVTNATYSYQ